MGFETLLGNAQLRENISASLSRGHISHFYLISGPRGSGKHTLARLLAAAILCPEKNKPCGLCSHCRKALSGNHPDFITVEDPEHKNVAVKIVRQYREDVYIRPNEADYKVYLFPQELGLEGQNALLKILEEPPEYGIFILLTDNPEKLLPTVRSRCTELKLNALPEPLLRNQLRKQFPQVSDEDLTSALDRSGGYLGQALEILREGDNIPPQTESFVRAFAGRDTLELVHTLVPMEKWKRDALAEILGSWRILMAQALTARSGGSPGGKLAQTLARSRSSRDLMEAARILEKAVHYCMSNVSTAAICGWLQWALR